MLADFYPKTYSVRGRILYDVICYVEKHLSERYYNLRLGKFVIVTTPFVYNSDCITNMSTRVLFDIAIGGNPRVVWIQAIPTHSQNIRKLPQSLHTWTWYRSIWEPTTLRRFKVSKNNHWVRAWVETLKQGWTWGESIYSERFENKNFNRDHNQPARLIMDNAVKIQMDPDF